jgi:hypothetical protein
LFSSFFFFLCDYYWWRQQHFQTLYHKSKAHEYHVFWKYLKRGHSLYYNTFFQSFKNQFSFNICTLSIKVITIISQIITTFHNGVIFPNFFVSRNEIMLFNTNRGNTRTLMPFINEKSFLFILKQFIYWFHKQQNSSNNSNLELVINFESWSIVERNKYKNFP